MFCVVDQVNKNAFPTKRMMSYIEKRVSESSEKGITKEEKAARLGFSLVSNHAFVDGNKRIGVYIMLSFLEINGIRINATNDDIVELGLSLADGSMKYEELLKWVLSHEQI